ncbi:MAG: F0F1 ATP synthase subunit B [Lachnospiraceae bacterium]|nr:F0F1 ATP synthase subunit B [Lachnospiraceae bacterium]
MTRLFDLDLQLIADAGLMIIAVFVLFLLASYLFFNPVRNMLQKRQEKIQGELDDAASDKEQASAMKAEYEEKLAKVDKEAEGILAEARKKALDNEKKILDEARVEAAAIIDRARNEAELEKKKAADDVKKEMVVLASMMAGKVVSQNIDTTVQDQIIEDTLEQMGQSTWLN